MVAIFTNQNLGIYNSSFSTLGSRGVFGNPSDPDSTSTSGVNAANGNLNTRIKDIFVAASGSDFMMGMSYNSQGRSNGSGDWRGTWMRRIQQVDGQAGKSGSRVRTIDQDGGIRFFNYDDKSQTYICENPGATRDILKLKEDGTWQLQYGASLETDHYATLAQGGYLLATSDANGNRTTLNWQNKRLTSITSASGERIDLEYFADSNNIKEFRSQTRENASDTNLSARNTFTRFEYDNQHRLIKVTLDLSPEDNSIADGKVFVTEYRYHGDTGQISQIRQTDGNNLNFEYDNAGRVIKVEEFLNASQVRTTRFTYNQNQTEVLDALGNKLVLQYDAEGRLTRSNQIGIGENSYIYNAQGKLEAMINARGNRTDYEYDAAGNRTLERDALGNTITRNFNQQSKLVSETLYTGADLDGKGKMLPDGALTRRQVWDQNSNLRFHISAEGRVHEYRYDSRGLRIAELKYTGAIFASANVADLNALSTWVNQLTLDDIERTDYTYDLRGELQSSTRFNTLDAKGNGILDGKQSTTHFIHDLRGRLLQSVDARGVATARNDDFVSTNVWDGLGRLLANTRSDENGNVLTVAMHQWQDAGQQATLTKANGLQTLSVFDAQGNLLTQTQTDRNQMSGTVLSRINYVFDLLGHQVASRAEVGDGSILSSYTLYDAAGRTIAQIDASGAMQEFIYDANGNQVQSIAYASRVKPEFLQGDPRLFQIATLRPSAENARIEYRIYDAADRLAKSIDAEGAVTAYNYDGADRLQSSIKFGRALSTEQKQILRSSIINLKPDAPALTPLASDIDRRTNFIYDADGRLLATIDAEGYLQETRYDAAGRKIQTVQWANQLKPDLRNSTNLHVLRPAASPDDIVHHFLYDNMGREIGVVDGKKYLIEKRYDSVGNLSQSIEWANPVTATLPASRLDKVRPTPASGTDRVTFYRYDSNNRLIRSESRSTGLITDLRYDADGNVVEQTFMSGQAKERQSLTRYDALGRVTAELSAENAKRIVIGMNNSAVETIWQQYATRYEYDKAGRRIRKFETGGAITSYFYNETGQIKAVIDAAGALEYREYNAFGDLIEKRRYLQALSAKRRESIRINADLAAAIGELTAGGLSTRRFTYDQNGHVIRENDTQNRNVQESSWNVFGERIYTSNLLDTGTRMIDSAEYDKRGQLLRTKRDAGGINATTTHQYDAFGREISSTGPDGISIRNSYDQAGRVIRVQKGTQQSTLEYDAFGRTIKHTDANGSTLTRYDDATRSVYVSTPEGLITKTTSDEFGQTLTLTGPDGNTITYSYNSEGKLLQESDALGSSKNEYDAAGRVLKSVDKSGLETWFSYDIMGRMLMQRIDPQGHNITTQTRFDSQGRPIWQQDAVGIWTRNEYDADGRLLAVTLDPAQDPDGNKRQQAANVKTIFNYDAAGRTLSVTEAADTTAKKITTYQYDNLNRRITETVAGATTRYEYDTAGRVTKKITPNGNAWFYCYDNEGRLALTVDGAGSATQTIYDPQNRVRETRRYTTALRAADLARLPASQRQAEDLLALIPVNTRKYIATQNFYNADGKPTFSIDAMGGVTQIEYDNAGRIQKETRYAQAVPLQSYADSTALQAVLRPQPERDRCSYTLYDKNSRPVWQVDAMGNVTRNEYDAAGRILRKTEFATPWNGNPVEGAGIEASYAKPGPQDRVERFAYDALGRQIAHIDAEGAVHTKSYDSLGRVTRSTDFATKLNAEQLKALPLQMLALDWAVPALHQQDRSTRTFYNSLGQVSIHVDALNVVTSKRYDAMGRTTASTRYAQAIPADTAASAINADDILRAVNPDPRADQSNFSTYDAAGRLIDATDAMGQRERYSYDLEGNKVSFTNKKNAVWRYEYDAMGRMLRETSPTVLAVSALTDSNGLLKASLPSPQSAITVMNYDALGRLTSRTEAKGLPEERTTTWEYDALGRQINTISATSPIYAEPLNQIAHNLRREKLETLTSTNSRVFYDALGNAVAGVDAAGALNFKTYNKLGQLEYEVDALGYVTERRYNAFGNITRLIRYAKAVSGLPSVITNAETAPNSSSILQALKSADNDRALQMEYNKLGQVVSQIEPVTTVMTSKGLANASKQTRTVWDAFGQASATEVLQDPDQQIWAITRNYYDRGGRLSASVDAENYLTENEYDNFNNLTSTREYAQRAGNINQNSYTRPNDGNADRRTTFQYDLLNRKTAENKLDRTVSDARGNQQSNKTLTTLFAYDAVGNQTAITDAAGGVQRNFYDVLGRVLATSQPERNIQRTDGSLVKQTPLTIFRCDILGNVIEQIECANGMNPQAADGFTPAPNNEDRTTCHSYDAAGHILQTTDAEGKNSYTAWDAMGRIGKTWRSVNGAQWFTAYAYDKTGRQIHTYTPASNTRFNGAGIELVEQNLAGAAGNGTVDAETFYNAFGEVTARAVDGTRVETYEFDNAGRAWRMQGQDGVVKVMIYDLAGNISAELRNSGVNADSLPPRTKEIAIADSDGKIFKFRKRLTNTADLSTSNYTQLDSLAQMSHWRRTDFAYDKTGHVVRQTQAAREVEDIKVSARAKTLELASGLDSAQRRQNIQLKWPSMAVLGSGDISISIDYLNSRNATLNFSKQLDAIDAAEGITLSELGTLDPRAIKNIVVKKADRNGQFLTVFEQAGFGIAGSVLDVSTPRDPLTTVTVQTRVATSDSDADWKDIQGKDFGESIRFDVSDTTQAVLSYRVLMHRADKQVTVLEQGTLNRTQPDLAPITWQPDYRVSQREIIWPIMNGAKQTLMVRRAGTNNSWQELPVNTGSNFHTASLRALPPEEYEFELVYTRIGELSPFAHATGKLSPANVINQNWGNIRVNNDANPTSKCKSYVPLDAVWERKVSQAAGSQVLRPEIILNVDRWGNVLSSTDPRNRKWLTSYEYDANNQMIKRRQPDTAAGEQVTRWGYDALGRKTGTWDELGRFNGEEYDAGGNLVSEYHADGGVVSHRFNTFNEEVRQIDAENRVIDYHHDKLGRRVCTTWGEVDVYSSNNLDSAAKQRLYESKSYDELGRLVSQTGTDGALTEYRLDLRGNITRTERHAIGAPEAVGLITQAAFDAFGRKLAEADENGQVMSWRYDQFGKLQEQRDKGGVQTKYTYDLAGQLTRQTSGRGQDLNYSYDAAGHVIRIVDNAQNSITEYGWDLGGLRVREKTIKSGLVYQDNHITFDALGRMVLASDAEVKMEIAYDKVGNRTRIRTAQIGQSGQAQNSDRWFAYDVMNRQVLVDAVDASGRITAAQGHRIAYDKNGNRISDTYIGNRANYTSRFEKVTGAEVTETYQYDAMNRHIHTSRNDGRNNSTTVDSRRYDAGSRTLYSGNLLEGGYLEAMGKSNDIAKSIYDAYGRLAVQTTLSGTGAAKSYIEYSSYDKAGNVLRYHVGASQSSNKQNYSATYEAWSNYKQTTLTVSGSGIRTTTSTQSYDKNGYLVNFADSGDSNKNRSFINDIMGKALYVNRNTGVEQQLIVNDQVLGQHGKMSDPNQANSQVADRAYYNFSFDKMRTGDQEGYVSHVMMEGDSLRSVAQAYYGDASMWYVLADANGLAGMDDVRPGQLIKVPRKASGLHNDYDSYKPYDPSVEHGDLAPVPQGIPAKNKKGCGGVFRLIVTVVAVAVTAWLAPQFAGFVANTFAITASSSVAAQVAATAVGYALGGAAGSIASQGTAIALGMQNGFSWKAVAMAAIESGVGGAVNFKMGGISPTASAFEIAKQSVTRAVIQNTISQGIGVITGLQSSFNWRGVASAGIAAGFQGVAQNILNTGQLGQTLAAAGETASNIIKGTISGTIGSTAAQLATGGRVNMREIAIDAFGNALALSATEILTTSISKALTDRPKSLNAEKSARRQILQISAPNKNIDDNDHDSHRTFTQEKTSSKQKGVRAGDYRGSLERIARAQLGSGATQREINNYVGQLFEINSITNARTIRPNQIITLPSKSTVAATEGLHLYGRDIAYGIKSKASSEATHAIICQAMLSTLQKAEQFTTRTLEKIYHHVAPIVEYSKSKLEGIRDQHDNYFCANYSPKAIYGEFHSFVGDVQRQLEKEANNPSNSFISRFSNSVSGQLLYIPGRINDQLRDYLNSVNTISIGTQSLVAGIYCEDDRRAIYGIKQINKGIKDTLPPILKKGQSLSDFVADTLRDEFDWTVDFDGNF